MIITTSESEQAQLVHPNLQNSLANYPLLSESEEIRSYFQADDLIDWQVLGKALTSLQTTFLMASYRGVEIQISVASGYLLRLDQTPEIAAGFELGDALLFTGFGNPGPLAIVFETPIFGATTQIQADTVKYPEYLVSIEAFDRLDKSLGKVNLAARSQREGGGVIPLSLFDSKGRIKKLVLNSKEQGIHMPFAISSVNLRTNLN
ncbi:MAG: PEP-CTERM sorting domain-containing protein [Methylacidiphilales bacterium]|nr:PEP-CTERM sorting domain-containing protein [Candidatus Methylacidiphilales bacterium]